jgi:hypothetical protein
MQGAGRNLRGQQPQPRPPAPFDTDQAAVYARLTTERFYLRFVGLRSALFAAVYARLTTERFYLRFVGLRSALFVATHE